MEYLECAPEADMKFEVAQKEILNVLLVEDDEDDYYITRTLLLRAVNVQCELKWVKTYEEGLEEIVSSAYDVCLIDYRLGKRDGLDLLRDAKNRGCRMPMILLTGQGTLEIDIDAMRAGAADYLVKGQIDTQLLERAIRYAIERKRADEALYESERRYRSVVRALAEGIIMREADGTIIACNASAERIMGLTADEMAGKAPWDPHWEAVHEDGSPFASDEHPAIVTLRDGVSFHDVVMGLDKPGGERTWISINTQPLFRNGEAKPYAVVASFTDITERKQVEKALRESEERFSKSFQAAPVAISIATLSDDRFLDINECFTQLTGFSQEDVIGLTSFEIGIFVRPRQRQRVRDLLEKHRRYDNRELQIRTQSGELRDILVSAEVIELIGEQCVLEMFYDITERKRLEREVLEISEREQRRIGQDLHDDLGQQLTAIAFFGDLLREKLEAEPSPHLHYIRRITELLEDARQSTRRLSRRLAPVDVQPDGLMDALQTLVEKTEDVFGIRCKFKAQERVLVRDGIMATHLYRMAQESVNNAIKHAQPKTITVQLSEQNGRVALSIQDDGLGISEEAQKGAEGIGLRTMRYRAAVINASFDIRRGEPRGTIIECIFDNVRQS